MVHSVVPERRCRQKQILVNGFKPRHADDLKYAPVHFVNGLVPLVPYQRVVVARPQRDIVEEHRGAQIDEVQSAEAHYQRLKRNPSRKQIQIRKSNFINHLLISKSMAYVTYLY